jgi:hypothetical protein
MVFVLIRIVLELLRRAGLPVPAIPSLRRRTTVLERLLLTPGVQPRRGAEKQSPDRETGPPDPPGRGRLP